MKDLWTTQDRVETNMVNNGGQIWQADIIGSISKMGIVVVQKGSPRQRGHILKRHTAK